MRQATAWTAKEVVSQYLEDDRTPIYIVNKLTDIDDKTMEEIAFYDETILVLQPVESEIKAYLETHDYLNLDPEINDSTWMMAFNSDTKVLIDKLKTTGDPVIDNADLDKKTYITLSGFFSC